jgi:hypothetical protein
MGACIAAQNICQEPCIEILDFSDDKDDNNEKIKTQSTSDLFQNNNSASIIVLEVLQNVSFGSELMTARISLF